MLDNFAMLTTTICMLYVIFRAAQMDRTLPWFEREAPPEREAASHHDAGRTGSNRL
jgi:hypothetical protein